MTPRKRVPPPIEDTNPPSPPVREQPASSEVAQPEEQHPGLLASLLASNAGEDSVPDAPGVLDSLVELRRKDVDPMNDYAPDGTRMLRWVQDAIAHEASLTRRRQQEVLRDAVLGTHPISEMLLDAHYASRYGKPRPKEKTADE